MPHPPITHSKQASTAKAAVEAKVPRYLLVSSAFVARPFHPIALMLSA